MNIQTKKSVVVIGGGLGGIALGARLAVQGFRVTLCEKNEHLGGKMNVLKQNGYSFDTGPSLITLLDTFRETFEFLGSSLENHVTPLRIDPLAHYVFADGLKLDYSTFLPDMLETIRKIEPRDVDGFLKFMRLGAKIYNLSCETFFNHSPFEFPPQLNVRVLKHLPLKYGWGNYARTVQAHFKSPYLRQLFNRYPTYVGSSPYRTPATLIVIPYIEYAYGGWFIKGGLYKIIEALKELAIKNGAAILTNALVSEIVHTNKTVKGVRLADGRTIQADIVAMNGDVSTVHSLLGEKNESALNISQRSLSGIVFLVGTSRTMPQVHHHSILFSDSYTEEFSQLFDLHQFPDDPTVYVNAASRSDRSVVPNEGETLFIMANAPASDSIAWNKDLIEKTWQAVLKRLQRSGFPEFQSSILFRETWTPNNLSEKFQMPGGAIYGKNSHGWKNTFLRPPNKDMRYKGLYYVGGSTHPGGGTPMVLLSAKIADRLIQKNETA